MDHTNPSAQIFAVFEFDDVEWQMIGELESIRRRNGGPGLRR